MKLPPWLIVGFALGATVVGVLWWVLRPNVVELQRRTDSLNTVLAEEARRRAEDAILDSARTDSINRLVFSVDSTKKVAQARKLGVQQARHALDSAVAGNSALEALVERQRASYEGVIAADSITMAALTNIIGVQKRQLDERAVTIAKQDSIVLALTKQRDQWRRVAQGSLLGKVAKTAATITTVVLACRYVVSGESPC